MHGTFLPGNYTTMKIWDKERRPRNNWAEGKFYDWAKSCGFAITRRGWPDFIITRGGDDTMLVEVKPPGYKLKQCQSEIMKYLASFGVPCYLWTPDKGLQKVASFSEPDRRRKNKGEVQE